MKKILLVYLAVALGAALVGCASPTAASTTATAVGPTTSPKPTPTADVAGVTPAVGFVVALYNNPPVYLYAGPSDTSTVLGQFYVGPAAQLLGTDPNNQWYLIKINGITAWVNSARVSATIAQ
jgi:uncharacterized protein YgiM (DUF1202 family)